MGFRALAVVVFLAVFPTNVFPQVTDNAATFHVFSQIADGRFPDGSYYRSTLMVANPSGTSSATCSLRFYGLRVTLTGLGTNTDTFQLSLAPNGWNVALTEGVQNIATGYATLSCDRAVTAQILYSYYVNSVKVSEATVFSSPPGKIIQLLSDHRENAGLGIAIANNTDRAVTYTIGAGNTSGGQVGTATLTIAARSATARFARDLIPNLPADHLGQIVISSGDESDVYAIGLRFTGVAFTTIPVTVRSSNTTGPKPFNQLQTERLYGTWRFTYASGTTSFTETYRLNDVQQNPSTPSDWGIWGTDSGNGTVLATWDSEFEEFLLLDQGSPLDRFYVFQFTGTDAITGCAYEMPTGTVNLSACKNLTGVRTSTSAITAAASLEVPGDKAAGRQEELLRRLEELR